MGKFKEYSRDQITEKIAEEAENGTEVCGVKVVLTEEGGVAGVMYSSTAAHKIEMLAGLEKGYIDRLVQQKFEEPLKELAREIARLKEQSYDSSFKRFIEFMSKEFNEKNSKD